MKKTKTKLSGKLRVLPYAPYQRYQRGYRITVFSTLGHYPKGMIASEQALFWADSFLRQSLERARLDWSDTGRTPEITVENEEEMIVWRDIWSAGQGVGLINDLPTVEKLAERLKAEYHATF